MLTAVSRFSAMSRLLHIQAHLDDSTMVRSVLNAQWRRYENPLCIHHDDLVAGVALFTKIAFEAKIRESFEATSDLTDANQSQKTFLEVPLSGTNKCRKVSLESPSSAVVDKVKEFVVDKAHGFRRICQTGFPFSLLERSSTEIALKAALENYYDPIVPRLMMQEGRWMNEEELNQRFAGPFQRLQVSAMAETCYDFKRTYVKEKENKAGYYLLWMLKQAAGCVYEIPEQSSFNNATVAEVLSKFFASEGALKQATIFVEILYYRSSRLDEALYQTFLDRKSCSIFLNFVVHLLKSMSMEEWPNKAEIITQLLETVTRDSQVAIARALASSKDPATAEVGHHASAALTARSLREAAPHYYALSERLLHFNHTHVEIIFGHPFIEFRHDKTIFKSDPEYTRRLHFNDMRRVFVHGSLMMGAYDTRTTFGGKGVPPYLLAFDMNTEKLVWGIPLTPSLPEDPSLNTLAGGMTSGIPRMKPEGYTLERVGEHVTLQFTGQQTVRFIRPETGEIDFTLELSEAPKSPYDCLHISPKGFVYQMVHKDEEPNRRLIGGRIIDKQWHGSFELETPSGFFHPLSTHCGFQEEFDKKLVVFGPTGDQVTFHGCMAAEAQGDKLYAIEEDSAHKDRCLLTIRTLKMDQEVVSGIEKRIPLNVKEATFGTFCQNGQLILFARKHAKTSPIFVDLNCQKVLHSRHTLPSYAEHTINADLGELWTWDQISKKIWKVSSVDVTLMGSLESGRGTTLLHADNANRLYFVDIPF